MAYFKTIECSQCGDVFVGVFPQAATDKDADIQEGMAMCGGFKDSKLVCKKAGVRVIFSD